MPDVPSQLLNLMSSLTVSGLPTSATPGDRIDLRITPDLAPRPDGALPPVLTDLTKTDVLAVLDVDPGPLLNWVVSALGLEGWGKAIEFDQPVTATPADLATPSPTKRALPHLVPGTTPALHPSPNVEGTIGRLKLTKDAAAGVANRLTGTLSKPGLLGTMTQPTVELRVFDETGTQLQSGNGFFQSSGFVPSLVFLPVAVPSAALQPTVRRTISVHVAMTFTPVTPPGAAPIPVTRDLGPFALDLATIEVPMVALLARHALPTSGAAPGHVFVGVPGNSPLNGLGDVVTALGQLRAVMSNLQLVLGALGTGIPTAITDAVRAVSFVPTVASDFRFGKGDLLGLWALFADWQFIMSAAMVFGPSTRRAFFGTTLDSGMAGFSLFPAPLGVGFIPDLNVAPIASGATVGTAVDNFPLPSGTYDNMLTSINFPAN
jgi:hypothetical protein